MQDEMHTRREGSIGMEKQFWLTTVFGEQLRRARKAANLTQEELAFRTHLDRTYISLLERGIKSPTLTTVFQLCRALGFLPDQFIAQIQASPNEAPSGSNQYQESTMKAEEIMPNKINTSIHCGLCQKPAQADNEIKVSALGVGTISAFFCDEHFASILQKAQEQDQRPLREEEERQKRVENRTRILELALAARTEPPSHDELHQEYSELMHSLKGKDRTILLPIAVKLYINAILIEWEAKQRGLSADYVAGTLFTISNKDIKLDEIQREAFKVYQTQPGEEC